MTKQQICAAIAVLMMAALAASPSEGGDWPMWGGSPSRNAVSVETGIPHEWELATPATAGTQTSRYGKNIKWVAPLGTYSYGGPVVAGGKVYVGTNNAGQFRPHSKGDKGCLLCFDEQTGKLLWQATHDKLASGPVNDWPEQGVASTPLVDGNCVYYVSNRCELICADAQGFRDGENDGPFKAEKHANPQDADFVWILDMIAELGVFPHNLAACAPVGAGELIFVCTSNGVGQDHETLPASRAPSFIAVNKKTGRVVWKRNDPGENILHGQWSSPAYGLVNSRPQVVFGGGDGWCYAFESLTGELIWKFNLNPPGSLWEVSGSGTKTSIVATPVIHDNKVFLAVGDDPESAPGEGHLYAIDATKKGDITQTGRIWHFGGEDFGRTLASAAIADGLLYAVDLDGFLSCLDVRTGRRHWRYDMEAAVWGSPCVVDGKVMLGNTDGELIVVQHGRTMKELARHDMRHAIYTTPAAANGVLYVVTQRFLYAIQSPRQKASTRPGKLVRESTLVRESLLAPNAKASTRPARRPAATGVSSDAVGRGWPMFRGNPQLTGVAAGTLPEKLRVRWRYEAAGAVSSTAAIVDGVVYVGSEEDTLYALEMATGKLKWKYQTEGAVQSSPAVINGLVIFGDDTGVLHACDAGNGAVRWKFQTQGQIISSVNYAVGPFCNRSIGQSRPTRGSAATAPAISRWNADRIVFGSYDGALYCVRPDDGKQIWKYQTEDRLHATPAIADNCVLIAGCDGYLHVVSLSDGKLIRRVALDSVTGCSPAVRGARAFLGTYGEQVLGIEWQLDRVMWRFQDPERSFPFLSSAAVTDELVIVGGRDKRLRALDFQTGTQRWQFAAKGRIDSSPVVVGERVSLGSEDGNLYTLKLTTGEELWRFETGAAIYASPAVAEGRLVIGTEDGLIYCFGGD